MDVNNASVHVHAKEWLDKGYDNEQIIIELKKIGFNERHLPEMLAEIKKLRNARKTSSGLMLILIGAVLCLLSCVLTMTSSYSHGNFSIVLYGFTTVGIVLVFGGLMKIFN
jgi:hypothetical protein